MIRKLLLIIVLTISFAQSQSQNYCQTLSFDTIDVFQDYELDTFTTSYGQNYNWLSQVETLNLFIAHPKNSVDTFSLRPMIVLIHGGSFHHGSRNDLVPEATYFARKGYVAASIDYRKGWNTGGSNNPADCLGDNTSHIQALYRAVQDAKAAIRFIAANSSLFKADTSTIFIGGTSSGAFTSLSTCYMSENDFETVSPGISSLLGGLDTASNYIRLAATIKGIMAYKDAIFDSSFISPVELISTIFLHGTADPYYPYLTGTAYTCPTYFTLQGAGLIAPYYARNGGCFELNYKINGDHGEIYPSDYTLKRRSHFLKNILCQECRQIYVENQVILKDSVLYASVKSSFIQGLPYKIYPNPTHGKINIVSDKLLNDKIVKLEIKDVFGRSVFSFVIKNSEYTIELPETVAGIYIMVFSINKCVIQSNRIIIY